MVVVTIAAAQGWFILFFNVMKACLSGKEIGRTVYTRGPADGLLLVNGRSAVRPYQLFQVLQGAYGLTEAPRLWYSRARELLLEIDFVELSCARAVFILRVEERTVAMLTLHVDDGMLAGDRTDKVYQAAPRGTNSKFNIKEWSDLKKGDAADYLGMQWRQDDEGATLDMGAHIGGVMEM
jgi:hypothetical protein